MTDPQTAQQQQQQQQQQPTIVYDANNPAVTITETKTVAGPPQFVLPPPSQQMEEQPSEALNTSVNETNMDSTPEESEAAMKAEAQVIRKIKEIDDSNKDITPLLANVEEENKQVINK